MNCKIFEIMKSYTDLEQFKKLAEILPIESADMFYSYIVGIERYYGDVPRVVQVNNHFTFFHNDIPCWSLAALLDVLKCFEPDSMFLQRTTDGRGTHLANVWQLSVESLDVDITLRDIYAHNLVDACYEMIIKLHELNLL